MRLSPLASVSVAPCSSLAQPVHAVRRRSSTSGCSAAELERYRRPAATASRGGTVPQPPYDPAKPHMAWPPEQYHHLLSLSDDELTQLMSQPEPPVKLAAA